MNPIKARILYGLLSVLVVQAAHEPGEMSRDAAALSGGFLDDLDGTIGITYSAIDDADAFTGKVSLNENASGEWTAAFTDYSNGVYSVKDTSSPLRNAGVSISGITEDIIGVSRPKSTANDIGAFEFNE